MPEKKVVFWFRRDLRFEDNRGLHAALSLGLPVVPLFIFDRDILDKLPDRDDRRVSFLHVTLQRMQEALVAEGRSLDVRYGKPLDVFAQLLAEGDLQAVYTNHDYEPYATDRDLGVQRLLNDAGVSFHTLKDQVIFERNEVVKPDGGGYSIYGPYARRWRAMLSEEATKPFPSEDLLHRILQQPAKALPSLEEMGFQFHSSIPVVQPADEAVMQHYHRTRNTPSVPGTSRMGPHLRFGTVSVRGLVKRALATNEVYVGELCWREFFMQLLWHQPRLVTQACKREYDNIRWRNNEVEFDRWCHGETGYPLVDAGMRELNETGFMHNRVRMVAASFLVKDLLVDWRLGEAYFANKLLDYELASNNGNWQWVAGCGCDAAPYFRVFNPAAQAKKFDPKAAYIKRWVPEVDTSKYPRPMVDHNAAKERCLKAYKEALGRTVANGQ